MRFDELRACALALPGVTESVARGDHSFLFRGQLFLRLKGEDATLLLRTDSYEREHLLSSDPGVFFIDARIREHPWVRIRLAAADGARMGTLVRDGWRRLAPARMVESFDRDHPA